ncbi:leucine-rich repeat-containing protein [Calothrix sp. NIES-2100]|uniref:leucine-rich repeat domain-containing protein n=1 Tax=Calothrix sp. NIES-2100 TaxID=1954172 RepID=UPI000B600BDE|nr:leucine-rich repeat-containing protein [Calothrix sp. NIES-2100]
MSEVQPNQTPNFHRFADWCLHKDSLSTEPKHTVEVLLTEAETCNCYKAEQRLTSLTGLNLNYQEICDLSPLSTLINLAYLELGNNHISNISPLSSGTQQNFMQANIF